MPKWLDLNAPPFRRPAAVVWYGSNVANGRNLESDDGQRANSRFTPGSRALHVYIDAAKPEIMSFLSRCRRSNLGRIWRILSATLESHLPGTGPRDGVAILIGQGNEHVVKRGTNMCLSVRFDDNILLAASTPAFLSFCHITLKAQGTIDTD